MENKKSPNKSVTVFLIAMTMLLSLALFGCGIYSLYISIGFRFLNRSAMGVNTNPLLTYPNSVYGTGSGTMMGLILVSIAMLGLGVGVSIIFFKQLPLFKQIKLISKMPMIKYKEYSQKVRKSVVVYSIIAYIICIAFSVFAIVIATRSGIASNYLWFIVFLFGLVLTLSIASLILMIVKIVQLSKLRKTFLLREQNDNENKEKSGAETQEIVIDDKSSEVPKIDSPSEVDIIDLAAAPSESIVDKKETEDVQPNVETKKDRLFSDGIFELGEQLQKLREMHISGLIDAEEYTLIREKWINAVLTAPLLGKKPQKRKKIVVERNFLPN